MMPLRKNERPFGTSNRKGTAMTEQEAPAATEADDAERRLMDAVFGPDGAPGEDGADAIQADAIDAIQADAVQEALNGIMEDAQRAAALRIWAKSTEEFDAEEQARYGVNADGTIADGGLTEAGKEFGAYVVDQINDVHEVTAKRREAQRAGRGSAGPLLVDALGLREPLRAAIRAGARALADRLDDDADDESEGEPRHTHTDDGSCRHSVVLGGEPFVLIRANKVPGTKFGAVTIAAGGGAYYASKGRQHSDEVISVEKMLALGTQGVEQFGGEAESAMGVDDVKRLLREGFGIDHYVGTVRPGTQRRGGSRAGAATEPGDAEGSDVTASGSGPSTEDPANPTWPATPSDTPRTGESEPASPKTGDDGCTSSPSSPSSGGDDAGSSGTVPSGE